MQLPRRTTIRGPAFIRLLAGLSDRDVPAPRSVLADRLSEWLDLNHAIALSAALGGRHVPATDAAAADATGEADCARVRAALAEAIVGDRAFAETASHPGSDYAFFRQRHLALQQAMDTGIAELRGRLRDRLAAAGAEQARLAAVDAAMERALGRRERTLLARVPAVLAQRFERLREAAQAAPADPPATREDTPPAPAWLATFRNDMQGALLAELDVRLHPIEGLLAALRTQPRA